MDAGGAADEGVVLRTAKSCGPDARRWRQVLEKLLAGLLGATVARKPGHRGEYDISRQNHRAGNAGCPVNLW
jgi:hypothetical protein